MCLEKGPFTQHITFLPEFDPDECPPDCSRPCENVCPADAISSSSESGFSKVLICLFIIFYVIVPLLVFFSIMCNIHK